MAEGETHMDKEPAGGRGEGGRGAIEDKEKRRCSKGVRDWKDSGTISTMERKKQAGRNAWRQVKTAD